MKQMQDTVLAQKLVSTLVRYGFAAGNRYPRVTIVDAVDAALQEQFPQRAASGEVFDERQKELPLLVPRVRPAVSPRTRAISLEKRSGPNLDRKKPVPAGRVNEAVITCAHVMLIAGYHSMRFSDALEKVRRIVVEAVSMLGYQVELDGHAIAWPIVKHWSVLARDDGADDNELFATAQWWREHPNFLRRSSHATQVEFTLAAL